MPCKLTGEAARSLVVLVEAGAVLVEPGRDRDASYWELSQFGQGDSIDTGTATLSP